MKPGPLVNEHGNRCRKPPASAFQPSSRTLTNATSLIPSTLLLALLTAGPATGPLDDSLSAFDPLMHEAMESVNATAASLCITRGDQSLARRAYGWFDNAKRRELTPDHTFRLGSNSKPFTAAVIYRLVESTDLELGSTVAPLLKIRSATGRFEDDRFADITIKHLLTHHGGFDREKSFDPMYRLKQIRSEIRPNRFLRSEDVITYMLQRPLDFEPGERRAYSNFGYVLLGRVIEAETGKPYEEAINDLLAKPLGIESLRVSHVDRKRRPPLEVDYPKESGQWMRVRAAAGGLTCTPEGLCKLMAAHWITGPPREGGRFNFLHYGSLPDTTLCYMEQRPDGTNIAIALNARRNSTYLEDVQSLRGRAVAILEEAASKEATDALDQLLNQLE